MEKEKRKRKRRKPKKKTSKSLFVEAVGFESKNIKSSNDKACSTVLSSLYKKGNIKKGETSANKDIKDLKLIKNRIKKRKKRMRTEKSSNPAVKSSDFNDNGTTCLDKHSTDQSMASNVIINTPSDVKFKRGPVSFRQTNKMSNTRTEKLSLKEKLQNKLESGRFRWINEKLYTTNSLSAFEMFKSEPELFDVYHQGFSSQVQKWPVNPVDTMIDWIMQRSSQLVIADMGCGEAKISQSVPNKVFSFDLVAVNDFVTACDMAKVPLSAESVDIVIYCLSLMGINLNDFLQEAHRILKSDGILKIAEVVSRFECLSSFEKTVSCFGFKLLTKDTTNKMFVQFEFKKLFKKSDQMKTLPLSLKPCLYKRR